MMKADGNTLLQQTVTIEVVVNNNIEVTELRHHGYQIVNVEVN
jgi:hypothetical protein